MEKILIPDVDQIAEIRMMNWTMEFLDLEHKGKVDSNIIDQVQLLLSNLSKDEIIQKLLAQEIERLNLGVAKDLNQEDGPSRDRRDRGRGRSGRGRQSSGKRRDNRKREDRDKGGREKGGSSRRGKNDKRDKRNKKFDKRMAEAKRGKGGKKKKR